MDTYGSVDVQLETHNYRPRQLFYHHNFHTVYAQAKAISLMLLFSTASRKAQLRCPHNLLQCGDTVLPSHILNSHSAVHIVPRLQKHKFPTWSRLHVYILGSRITFMYKVCICDFTVRRATGYELGCQVAVFVMGVGTVSSSSWTSKLWSTSSHLMGAADSSPYDKGGYSLKPLNLM
jgi:hypothetical protein